jgi:hypothetical protein
MVVGYTCWDGYGHPTKVTPVDPHHPEQYDAAHAEYLEYQREKKEKEAGGKGGDPKEPEAQPPEAGASGARLLLGEDVEGVSTYLDYYDLSGIRRFSGPTTAHRFLAPKKKYPPGMPYCEEICELEPNKEIEIAEGFAMATFTVDYLLRLFTVHAVPYRVIHPEAYVKNRAVRALTCARVRARPSGGEGRSLACFFFF